MNELDIRDANPLELQVMELGICPRCHTKTLVEKHRDPTATWLQCSSCNVVCAIDPDWMRQEYSLAERTAG